MDLMITPNYTRVANKNFNNKYNTVQFKGGVGEELLRRGFDSLNPETCKKAAKGTFGLSTEKVTDIFGSLIQTGKSLTTKLSEKTGELNAAQTIIAAFPKEKEQAVRTAEDKLYQRIQEINMRHQKEIAAKDAEIAQLRKYEGMIKVKSVEEVGCLTPERVMAIMDEATEMRTKAHESMETFLFKGKGQEDAIVYLNKMAELYSAYQDGTFKITEISNKEKALNKEGIYRYGSHPVYVALDMVEEVLTTSDSAQWLKAPKIREQFSANANALMQTLCDETMWNEHASQFRGELNDIINRTIDYKANYSKGLESVLQDKDVAKVHMHIIPYNWRASYITRTYDNGYTENIPAQYVSNWGKNNNR